MTKKLLEARISALDTNYQIRRETGSGQAVIEMLTIFIEEGIKKHPELKEQYHAVMRKYN